MRNMPLRRIRDNYETSLSIIRLKTNKERLTKPLNVSPADEYAGKREKRLVDIGTAFAADE